MRRLRLEPQKADYESVRPDPGNHVGRRILQLSNKYASPVKCADDRRADRRMAARIGIPRSAGPVVAKPDQERERVAGRTGRKQRRRGQVIHRHRAGGPPRSGPAGRDRGADRRWRTSTYGHHWSPVVAGRAIFQLSVAEPYISWQSTSTLLVTPLVTVTGPEAWQSAVPPLYCGLCPETVYLPTGTGAENRPFAATVMPVMCPLGPWRVICPLRARGPTPEGPPTAWSVPVRVPVGPEGPLGDEQLASNTEAAMTGIRESKVSEPRCTAHPPSRVAGLLVRKPDPPAKCSQP